MNERVCSSFSSDLLAFKFHVNLRLHKRVQWPMPARHCFCKGISLFPVHAAANKTLPQYSFIVWNKDIKIIYLASKFNVFGLEIHITNCCKYKITERSQNVKQSYFCCKFSSLTFKLVVSSWSNGSSHLNNNGKWNLTELTKMNKIKDMVCSTAFPDLNYRNYNEIRNPYLYYVRIYQDHHFHELIAYVSLLLVQSQLIK